MPLRYQSCIVSEWLWVYWYGILRIVLWGGQVDDSDCSDRRYITRVYLHNMVDAGECTRVNTTQLCWTTMCYHWVSDREITCSHFRGFLFSQLRSNPVEGKELRKSRLSLNDVSHTHNKQSVIQPENTETHQLTANNKTLPSKPDSTAPHIISAKERAMYVQWYCSHFVCSVASVWLYWPGYSMAIHSHPSTTWSTIPINIRDIPLLCYLMYSLTSSAYSLQRH